MPRINFSLFKRKDSNDSLHIKWIPLDSKGYTKNPNCFMANTHYNQRVWNNQSLIKRYLKVTFRR